MLFTVCYTQITYLVIPLQGVYWFQKLQPEYIQVLCLVPQLTGNTFWIEKVGNLLGI